MKTIGRIVLFWLLCSFCQLPGQPNRTLDYTGFATTFLKETGLEELARSPAGHTFSEVLDGPAFARVELVGLDVRFPASGLREAGFPDRLREICEVLCQTQQAWQTWYAPEAAKRSADDWKTLSRWVASWNKNQLAAAPGGQSLYESLKASPEVLEAARRLSAPASATSEEASAPAGQAAGTLQDGAQAVEAALARPPGQILFAPTRKDYIQILSVAGLLDATDKQRLWDDRVLKTTIEWIGWTQLVALEYARLPVDTARPFDGVPLNTNDKTGMEQYVAERGAAVVLRNAFANQQTHFFEQTLATNLVIAATGENNLRSGDWKLEIKRSGASTPPYERFVPGGNPNGGTLPARPAGPGVTSGSGTELSKYRSSMGKDWFLGPLKDGQKLGAKLASKNKKAPNARDKLANFRLYSLAEREESVVAAPFLGELAEKKTLPGNAFLDDYEDFYRAYRAAFFQWLRTEALPTEAESADKFAQLIQAHADQDPLSPMDPLVEEIYGLPLSRADGSEPSLEWRFLAWLSKKK